MWIIYVERIDFKFNNIRWDVKNSNKINTTQHMIWQSLLEYARTTQDIVCNDADRATIYDDVLENYDKVWRGNELLHHRDNTITMHWNIIAP